MVVRGIGRARASLACGSHRDNRWGWPLWEMLCSPGATRWVETGALLSMQSLGGQWVGWRLSALLNPLARWVGLKPPRHYAHWELIGLAGAFQYVVCTKAMGRALLFCLLLRSIFTTYRSLSMKLFFFFHDFKIATHWYGLIWDASDRFMLWGIIPQVAVLFWKAVEPLDRRWHLAVRSRSLEVTPGFYGAVCFLVHSDEHSPSNTLITVHWVALPDFPAMTHWNCSPKQTSLSFHFFCHTFCQWCKRNQDNHIFSLQGFRREFYCKSHLHTCVRKVSIFQWLCSRVFTLSLVFRNLNVTSLDRGMGWGWALTFIFRFFELLRSVIWFLIFHYG